MKFQIKIIILSLILLFSAGIISAQPTIYRIRDINVSGNKTYDAKTIIAYSGLKIGMEISIPSDETRDAINKLWAMGLFSDIKLYVEKKAASEIFLKIEVEELPRIESIDITGYDDISKSDIESRIGLVTGEVVSEQKLKDIEYNLKKYYESEGYSMAEVTVDKLISSSNEARIRLKINEGKKVTVRNIKFEGNRKIKSSKLRSQMETSEKVWWKFWDGANLDKNVLEEDKKLIINYYKENGYRDAEITGIDLKLSADKEDVNIKIKINEGQLYYINNIKFSGNKLYPDSLLYERLDIRKGDIYNYTKLTANLYGNESETDISSLYYDNGYLAYSAETDENVVNGNKVDLMIKITENRQFKLGLITFEGNDKTKDKVIRRELYTIPGDYFNRSNLKRSLQQLNALNYFNPEKLGQDIALENDSTVNLKYIVSERSSDQFNASIGYSGSFGFTGALGLTFNNFEITDPLAGGGGQILNFTWQFGEGGTYRTFNIGFTEPWLFDTPTLLGVNLYDTRQTYYYDVRETGVILNFGRRLKWPDDYFRGDWALKIQSSNVIDGGNYYQTGLRNQFSIRQTITRSTVFDPIFPLSGTKVSNLTELSGGPFLPGNMEFIKNVFSTELYTPLFRNTRLVLYSNFNFFFVNSFGKDDYLPPTELFYMGGNGLAYNTIPLRGYDDRNVGPKNSSLNPIGGKVALKYTLELRYPLSLDPIPIFALAFAEAGNVWTNISKTDPFDLRRSVGFGVRLMLPAVGLIGFDFGYGFDRKREDFEEPKWLFHFQFGRGF
jgi:outer membrane protein insertion porin family